MPKRADATEVQIYLAELIDYENIRNQELMQITGMPASQVSKWKNGNAFPQMDELIKICQRLGISLDSLYDLDRSQMADLLKIEKYGWLDDIPLEVGNFADYGYVYTEELLKDKECEKVLKSYVNLLKSFNDEYDKYLKGLSPNPPVEKAKQLYFYYNDDSEADDGGIHELVETDLVYYKEFIINEYFLDYQEANPHFYPINADYVMLMYYNENKELILKYLDEISRLDKIFNYNKDLSHRLVNKFFSLYEELMTNNEIRDSHGELFKRIIGHGGLLGDESRYANLIDKLIK